MIVMRKSLFLSLVFFISANVSLSAQLAPNFTITDTDGVEHNLYEDYLDQGKTVLIKMFFVNCPPCRAVAPSMQTLYEEWGEGQNDVQFIELSIRSGDSNADVAGYKSTFNLTFPGAGFDGGALQALEPYTSGTYGSFFGTPEFAVISPNRYVNYGVGGGGVSNTISQLDAAIAATGAQKPTEEIEPTTFDLQIEDAFGNNINDLEISIESANATQSYPVTLTGSQLIVQSFEDDFPGLIDPVIRIRKTNEVYSKISAADLIIMIKEILRLNPITDPNLQLAADTNGDGSINTLDLITLQRVILRLFSEFPGVDSYQFIPNEIPVSLDPGNVQSLNFIAVKTGDLNGF